MPDSAQCADTLFSPLPPPPTPKYIYINKHTQGEFHASQISGIGHYKYHTETENEISAVSVSGDASYTDGISRSGGQYDGEMHLNKRSGDVGKMKYANGDIYKGKSCPVPINYYEFCTT